MSKKLMILLFLLPLLAAGQQEDKADRWESMRFLEGVWEGEGYGMSGISEVRQEYQFILNGQFLRMTTKAVFKPQEKNPEGEVHEDLGIFSYDQSRETFVLRGFYVEGFVNRYVLDGIPDGGRTLSFLTEQIENAPPETKAKLVFKRIRENELEQSFHVSFPGQEFSCLSTNRLTRRK